MRDKIRYHYFGNYEDVFETIRVDLPVPRQEYVPFSLIRKIRLLGNPLFSEINKSPKKLKYGVSLPFIRMYVVM